MTFFNPLSILAILISLSVHEWSHAMVATRLGDPTPHSHGRLTLNPLAHLDMLGAILFLTVGFGWAKPVPVNPVYFSDPKHGTMLTALAGPLSNFFLALFAYIVLGVLGYTGDSVWQMLMTSPDSLRTVVVSFFSFFLFINLGMMAFNLLPIAPLDGSKIVQAFVPLRHEDQFDQFLRMGPYILLGILLSERIIGLDLFGPWIGTIMDSVLHLFNVTVGSFFR